MDWRRSYSAAWRIFRVNRDTWADGEQIAGFDSVSVTRTAGGNLLESGSLEITGNLEPDYYRIVMTSDQGGDMSRVDIATLLFDVKGSAANYGTETQSADGYSVLYPASTTTITNGEYAPAGVDGAAYAGRLLADAINAPVVVDGSFTLNEHIVHEFGSYVLDAVWAVLNAGGYVIQIDGRGVVYIRPKPTEPTLILDSTNMRLLTNGAERTSDISAIPNRYIVITDDLRTMAVNNDPDSTVSTASRGYYVDMVDTSPTPVNGETYSAYASRRLREVSVLEEEYSYEREYFPGAYLYSMIKASLPGLSGDLRITSQTVHCGKGITIDEKAVKEVTV